MIRTLVFKTQVSQNWCVNSRKQLTFNYFHFMFRYRTSSRSTWFCYTGVGGFVGVPYITCRKRKTENKELLIQICLVSVFIQLLSKFSIMVHSYSFYSFNVKFYGWSCWSSLNQCAFICNWCWLIVELGAILELNNIYLLYKK